MQCLQDAITLSFQFQSQTKHNVYMLALVIYYTFVVSPFHFQWTYHSLTKEHKWIHRVLWTGIHVQKIIAHSKSHCCNQIVVSDSLVYSISFVIWLDCSQWTISYLGNVLCPEILLLSQSDACKIIINVLDKCNSNSNSNHNKLKLHTIRLKCARVHNLLRKWKENWLRTKEKETISVGFVPFFARIMKFIMCINTFART